MTDVDLAIGFSMAAAFLAGLIVGAVAMALVLV